MTRDITYFPVGTVVVLKDSTAAAMISGYLAENEAAPGYIWDYCGFLYPIGLRDEKEVYTFDHTQIDQVLAIGYQDGEYFAFMSHLKEVAVKMAEIEEAQIEEREGSGQDGAAQEVQGGGQDGLAQETQVQKGADQRTKEQETEDQE